MISIRRALIFVLFIAVVASAASGKRKTQARGQKAVTAGENRQIFIQSRETDTPNFVLLLFMRLVYGLAVQVGAEDRLGSFLNGFFVPPNADADGDDDPFESLLGDIGGGGDGLFDF